MSDAEIKQQVQEFYDRVGWQQVSAGTYQNATYEDLRPVAREYVHRCHLRVNRHLEPAGEMLLDAGSGPIQYPEYVEYSQGYRRRVCLDISSVALQEARQRIGEHGLFVVGDIANLPFKADAFDGLVSLHTIHHLPADEHARAYLELQRVLAPGKSGVVVNGWDLPPLTQLQNFLIRLADTLRRKSAAPLPNRGEAGAGSSPLPTRQKAGAEPSPLPCRGGAGGEVRGTFVRKHTPAWLKKEVGRHIPVEIWCWRSLSVRFMRTFIHQRLGGEFLLRLLFWLEERLPHYFGRNGQYPLIVLRKRPR